MVKYSNEIELNFKYEGEIAKREYTSSTIALILLPLPLMVWKCLILPFSNSIKQYLSSSKIVLGLWSLTLYESILPIYNNSIDFSIKNLYLTTILLQDIQIYQ
mgnify:CR=1 FL=1